MLSFSLYLDDCFCSRTSYRTEHHRNTSSTWRRSSRHGHSDEFEREPNKCPSSCMETTSRDDCSASDSTDSVVFLLVHVTIGNHLTGRIMHRLCERTDSLSDVGVELVVSHSSGVDILSVCVSIVILLSRMAIDAVESANVVVVLSLYKATFVVDRLG
jgi:hypothetical protein